MKQTPTEQRHGRGQKVAATQEEELRDPLESADKRDRETRLRKDHNRLIDMLREERERNEFILSGRASMANRTPTIIQTERRSGLREMTAVCMLSDAHVEETVELESTLGRNEYNLARADDSLKRFARAVVNLVRHHRASKDCTIHDIVLSLCGDLMTGYIHEELMESNQLSPVETVNWLFPRLVAIIDTILYELNPRKLLVPCSHGNHGRTTQKIRRSTGSKNSYEWLLYKMLEQHYEKDKRVVFDTSMSAHQFVNVYDYTLHFTHGDETSYQGGIGGLSIPLLKRVARWDLGRYAHYHHCGHWHQFVDFGRMIVNGSVIGYTPYAISVGANYEPPQQMFYLLDSKRGKTHVTPLWVRPEESALASLQNK